MTLIGHEQVFKAICQDTPAVTLLRGPASVGKWTLAEEVLRQLAVPRHNVCRVKALTADAARTLTEWSATASIDGQRKFLIIRLDHASDQAQNMLLKFLEKPGPGVRVLLVTSTPVLPTIISRSRCYNIGLLTDSQVEQVLVQGGMDPSAAKNSALSGGGQVVAARDGLDPRTRSLVVACLRALESSSQDALSAALREWDFEAHHLLGVWAAEAAVGRFRVFDQAVSGRLTSRHARRVLGALAQYPAASPKNAAHAALGPLCTKA